MEGSGIIALTFFLMLWSVFAAGGNATTRKHMLNLAIGLFLGSWAGTEVYRWREFEMADGKLWGLGAFIVATCSFVVIATKRNWNSPNFMHRIAEKGELARLDRLEDETAKAKDKKAGRGT